jgi:hypothetical protein
VEFTFDSPYNAGEAIRIDLKAVEQELGDGTWETLSSAIMLKISAWSVAWSNTIASVDPGDLLIDGVDIAISTNGDWIVELAQLFTYLNDLPRYQEPDVYLAYLNGNGWGWSDFDNIDDWTDEFYSEYPDDLDDYGRERMSESEFALPDHLEAYFDYAQYAEDSLDELNKYKWNGTEYLFSS